MRRSRANAEDFGLIAGTATINDGTLTMNNVTPFGFDRSDGLAAGRVVFFGVAAHEFGHVRGFTSGVEFLDANGGAPGFKETSTPSSRPSTYTAYPHAASAPAVWESITD